MFAAQAGSCAKSGGTYEAVDAREVEARRLEKHAAVEGRSLVRMVPVSIRIEDRYDFKPLCGLTLFSSRNIVDL